MFVAGNQMEYIIINLCHYIYNAFLHSIKFSKYRMRTKFDKDPLAVEQINYLTKIVNVYIVYELNASSKNPGNNFKFKNCLFGATNIVKNSDKEKCVYGGYGKTFNSATFWSFDNDTTINVIRFGVDYSSSSHSEYSKNNFLTLSKGRTFGINGSFGDKSEFFSSRPNKMSFLKWWAMHGYTYCYWSES